MTDLDLQQRGVFLLETLLSGLDARESAKCSGSLMLVYLADMLVQRAREELDAGKPAEGARKRRGAPALGPR